MIIRPIARQRRALLNIPSSSRPSRHFKIFPSQQFRSAYTVPTLGPREKTYVENGVGELFSGKAFNVAWRDYQTYLVDRLNTTLAGEASRTIGDVRTLTITTAREPSMAAVFNFASMAYNNHFFFQTLSPRPTEMPDELHKHLTNSFSSIDTLRSEFLATAAAMFGPGFVWLVQTDSPSPTHPTTANALNPSLGVNRSQLHFRLVSTYLAGSPLPQAHTRQQGRDMNVENLQSAQDFTRQKGVQNTAGSFGAHSASALGMAGIPLSDGVDGGDARRYGVADITPVLCVNTWEHCYLHDFGVAGKRAYLEKWWDSIDWDKVWSQCIKTSQLNYARR